MPRTTEQFDEIRDNRRQLIMETALELFAYNGYHTTSIRKIAATAGFSYGLLYNYFDSKEQLVRAIIHQGIDQMLSIFDKNKDGDLTDEELTFFVMEYFKIIRNNLPFWKLYYAIQTQPSVSNMVVEEYKEHLPDMRAILIHFFRAKGIPHPEMEALYLSALMDGICLNIVMDPKDYPLEQMRNMILEKLSKPF